MDSMQVYRHMDVGTAKPSPAEQASVPHHLIDIINPDEQYDAARFVNDALVAIEGISSRNRTVLLTGGTGLYLKALLRGCLMPCPRMRPFGRSCVNVFSRRDGRCFMLSFVN